MKKINRASLVILAIVLSEAPLFSDTYVDNGDGTVSQTNVTVVIDPKTIAKQIERLQDQMQATDVSYQSQIEILTQQLQDIDAQVPTVAVPVPPIKMPSQISVSTTTVL